MSQRRTCYTVRQRIYSFKSRIRLQRICSHNPGEYAHYYVKLNEIFYVANITTLNPQQDEKYSQYEKQVKAARTHCARLDGSLQFGYQVRWY